MSEIVKREQLFAGSRFRLFRVSYRGHGGRVYDREIVDHPGSVVILPIVAPGRVCLVRNYRVAIDRYLIELPAGTLNPGERPERAALRELQEETGFIAAGLSQLCQFYPSPGILNERMVVYEARDLTPGEPQLDPGEIVEPVLYDFDAVDELIRNGAILDGKTIAAWLYFRKFSA